LLKSILRSFRKPLLPYLWKFVQDDLYSKLNTSPDFPNSASKSKLAIDLTIEGSKNSLAQLVEVCSINRAILNSAEFKLCITGRSFSDKFASLFAAYGSDKSTTHPYEDFYAQLMCNMNFQVSNLLEIGIGTNNSHVPSNMGPAGNPGASLLSWSDLFPSAKIVGADIDKEILLFSGNIESYYLDQTDDASWLIFKQSIPKLKFDIIIDDGLHSPNANFKTIKHSLSLLNDRGVMVIEDIPERSLPYWLILREIGIKGFDCELTQAGNYYLFSISKKLIEPSKVAEVDTKQL
jgi:hypothetical protein